MLAGATDSFGGNFMKSRMFSLAIVALALTLAPTMASAGSWTLWDWSAYIDGATFNPPGLPASVNAGGFDFGTGLGSLVFNFDTAGAHSAGVYFFNFYDNGFGDTTDSYASVSGAQPAGLTFEMGIPGFGSPTVFDDFSANALGNTYSSVGTYAPPPSACCDVAMAEIYSFTLSAGYTAAVTFTVSGPTVTGAPPSGFYLEEIDHDTGSMIFLTQSYQEKPVGGPTIPEPGTILLTAGGVCMLWFARKRTADKSGRS